MDRARDRATDQLVNAREALPRRRYRCDICNAPVHLRSGSDRRPHFAHASGKADPDCLEFYPSEAPYTGRHALGGQGQSNSEAVKGVELLFDVTEQGPLLTVLLPPSKGTGQWNGLVDFEAHRVSRRLTNQHLQNGQRIDFKLSDGQWSINTNGDISADYESRLDLGMTSLESGLNVFDATHSPAPQLGPSRAIRLGDSVWVITRQATFNWNKPDSKVLIDRCATLGGWHVEHVQLPRTASQQLVERLAKWLQRPIRPARACVFVAQPWPSGITEGGMMVYSCGPGGIELISDRSVDLRIVSMLGHEVARANEATSLRWEMAQAGSWNVLVNGELFLSFVTEERPAAAPPAIEVSLHGGPPRLLYEAQTEIEQISSSLRRAPLTVRWSVPEVGHCLKLNGRPLENLNDGMAVLDFEQWGAVLSAGNFGTLRWPDRVVETHAAVRADTSDIYARAQWMLSKALPLGTTAGIPIRMTERWCADRVVGVLQHRRWSLEFQPQLQVLLRSMDAQG
jgi:hypothetical protein